VVGRSVPATNVSSDEIGAPVEIKKEVDELKRIIFLIVASLMLLGLVLPGCTGETPPEVGDIVFEDGKINVGIAGELSHMTGQFQMIGAQLAIAEIGTVDIDGEAFNLTLVPIETGEATRDPTGGQGTTAMIDKIDDVNFIMGGFRTEAVVNYREVAVGPGGEGVIFWNAGAATEALQQSVVTDYDNYKYWFHATPYNEYFLGQTIVRNIDAVGRLIRAAGNMTPDATLRAVMVADNLAWAQEEVEVIESLLPGINVNLASPTVFVNPLLVDPSQWAAILTPLAGVNPHFVIPVLSADAGVAFAGVRKAVIPNAMAVGINVPGQFKSQFAADLGTPPPGGPTIQNDIIIDTWAEEVEMTAKTQPFMTGFMAFTGGEYPLYTAATYDAMFSLAAAIESEAWYDSTAGKGYANTDDIIAWLEDPDNQQVTTTGKVGYYPLPGATGTNSTPALTEAQVLELYPHIGTAGYPAYDVDGWTTPAHTAHDLVYGPGYLTGLGDQWQWDATATLWKKYAVWPMEITGADLKDQYGDWNFEYTGTKAIQLNPAAVHP